MVSFNPVEENLHTGIIEATDILVELKEKYHLSYILGINNDYICPLYPGDEVKTIYIGMVGKLLPCFYIQGKETHVGQCFEGLDASMIAAELVRRIHLNHDFIDEYEGEYTYPPSVLKMKDLKPWYNVQTTGEALVYFNYFVHNATIDAITDKLKKAAEEVMETILEMNRRETSVSTKAGIHQHRDYNCKVMTMKSYMKKSEKSKVFQKKRCTGGWKRN